MRSHHDAWRRVFPSSCLQLIDDLSRHFAPHVEAMLQRREAEFKRCLTSPDPFDGFYPPAQGDAAIDEPAPEIPPRVRGPSLHLADVDPARADMFGSALQDKHATGIQCDFDDGFIPSKRRLMIGHRNVAELQTAKLEGNRHVVLSDMCGTDRRVSLGASTPDLILRPRSWNMKDPIFGIRGCLVDVCLFVFHAKQNILQDPLSPLLLYLPKLEHPSEAALWRSIFVWLEDRMELPRYSIRVCILIESASALYCIKELARGLHGYIYGVNSGIFDFVGSALNRHGDRLTDIPDRSRLNTSHALVRAYVHRIAEETREMGLILTGGMIGKFPEKPGLDSHRELIKRAKAEEIALGYEGFLVYPHPAYPHTTKAAVDFMARAAGEGRPSVPPAGAAAAPAPVTRPAFEHNIEALVAYAEAWVLPSPGSFILSGGVEDSATIEVSRALLHQWVRRRTVLEEGEEVTEELFLSCLRSIVGRSGWFDPDERGGRWVMDEGPEWKGGRLAWQQAVLPSHSVPSLIIEWVKEVVLTRPCLVTDHAQGFWGRHATKEAMEGVKAKL